MNPLLDRYLLFRIRTKQDPEAFARIYDRYVEAIYRYVFLKVSTKEEAQDITAETFTRVWQYVRENKRITHIRALLYQIARNLIADHYRRRGRRQGDGLEETVTFSAQETSTLLEGQSDGGMGKEIMEIRADASLVLRQLDRLKEDHRDVLILRIVHDLSFSVIGQILEKKSGHVRVIYHRALKALASLEDFS